MACRQLSFLCLHSLSSVCAAAAKSLQLCLTLCNPIDSSPPGSSVHGIFQARVLEWTAIAFSTCVCDCVLISHSCKDPNHVELESIHMASLYLNYLFKEGSISKYSHISRHQWIRASKDEFCKDMIHPVTNIEHQRKRGCQNDLTFFFNS